MDHAEPGPAPSPATFHSPRFLRFLRGRIGSPQTELALGSAHTNTWAAGDCCPMARNLALKSRTAGRVPPCVDQLGVMGPQAGSLLHTALFSSSVKWGKIQPSPPEVLWEFNPIKQAQRECLVWCSLQTEITAVSLFSLVCNILVITAD